MLGRSTVMQRANDLSDLRAGVKLRGGERGRRERERGRKKGGREREKQRETERDGAA